VRSPGGRELTRESERAKVRLAEITLRRGARIIVRCMVS